MITSFYFQWKLLTKISPLYYHRLKASIHFRNKLIREIIYQKMTETENGKSFSKHQCKVRHFHIINTKFTQMHFLRLTEFDICALIIWRIPDFFLMKYMWHFSSGFVFAQWLMQKHTVITLCFRTLKNYYFGEK